MRCSLVALSVMSTLGLLAVLAGCERIQPADEDISTTVVAVAAVDGTPVSGLEVVLVDRDRGRPVVPSLTTDERGEATVSGLQTGRYAWLPLPDQGWMMAQPPLTVDLGGTDPKTTADIRLELLATTVGGPTRVSGTVYDDVTGEPLAGVVIGLPGWPDAWDGILPPQGDITDADGAFAVTEIIFVVDSGGGEPFQFHPLVFQRQGYQPVARRFDLIGGDAEEITGLEIRLTPLADDGTDTGALAGRVVFRGDPVAGVEISATWLGDGDKNWLGHPDLVAETDADGIYTLTGLPAGLWLLEPGYVPGDGWLLYRFSAIATGALPAVVAAGETTGVEDLPLLRAVTAVYPRPGEVGVDSLATFSWLSIAEADSYDVYIGRWYFGRTEKLNLTIPDDFPLNAGIWSWHVEAMTAAQEIVGASDVVQQFVVGQAP